MSQDIEEQSLARGSVCSHVLTLPTDTHGEIHCRRWLVPAPSASQHRRPVTNVYQHQHHIAVPAPGSGRLKS